jgi:hypothetical protein
VALQPQVVLGDQLLPGFRPREEVVGEPALQVEVGLDEGLPGLPALYLELRYAQRGVDGWAVGYAIRSPLLAEIGDERTLPVSFPNG